MEGSADCAVMQPASKQANLGGVCDEFQRLHAECWISWTFRIRIMQQEDYFLRKADKDQVTKWALVREHSKGSSKEGMAPHFQVHDSGDVEPIGVLSRKVCFLSLSFCMLYFPAG